VDDYSDCLHLAVTHSRRSPVTLHDG